LALVDMSVVEQRYRAVLAVQSGETATTVAAQFGVSRQSVQNWLRRYRDDGLAGLVDQPKRPDSSPGQLPVEVETLICEMRRAIRARRLGLDRMRVRLRPVRGATPPDLDCSDNIDGPAQRRRAQQTSRTTPRAGTGRETPAALIRCTGRGDGVVLASCADEQPSSAPGPCDTGAGL
jgi:transposase-like protein